MRRSNAALSGLVLLWGTLGAGCKQEAPPAAEEPRAPTAEAAAPTVAPAASAATALAASAAPAPVAGTSRVSEDKFELVVQPSGAYQAGKEGSVEIVLVAKAPYHVNDQYPYKFKTKEAAGVKFPAAVVGKDKGKLEKQRFTLPVAFVADQAGQHTVAGQFAFSVCTEENCLMDKRELALVVDVK